jgi:predicted ABC-type ATPase
LVVLAGPNGAGKSTSASLLLRDALAVREFVNADTIAAGLSGLDAQRAAMAAGRIMLGRIRGLARARSDFAFETTLASRSFAPWIQRWKGEGYRLELVFLWLPTPAMAVERVAERVRLGGHSVPEETVRRRYERGLRNFFTLYRPLADNWYVFDNSNPAKARLVARGSTMREDEVADVDVWKRILAERK